MRISLLTSLPLLLLVLVFAFALAMAAGGRGAQGAGGVRVVVPGLASDGAPGEAIYLALGDSLAAGRGASEPAVTGYVPRFGAYLASAAGCAGCAPLRVVNLGVAGATSADVLSDQLPQALAAIEAGGVRAITVDVGADDGLAQVSACTAGESLGCLATAQQVLATFAANFEALLSGLRSAAPGVPILTMTYYNPLTGGSGTCLAQLSGLVQLFLEGGPGLGSGLNGIIRQTAAAHGVLVAETIGRLGPGGLAGGGDCVHPNDTGYAVIAGQFEAAWAGR